MTPKSLGGKLPGQSSPHGKELSKGFIRMLKLYICRVSWTMCKLN